MSSKNYILLLENNEEFYEQARIPLLKTHRMWKVITWVKACYLIFLARSLFALSSMLTFSGTRASGHKGRCYFHGSVC